MASNSQYPTNEELARRSSVVKPDSTKRRSPMAAVVLRLAARLGRDPEDVVAGVPEDTLRRLKYPVLEEAGETTTGDPTIAYKDDPQIIDGGRIHRF